jgi:hypothetical protein
LGPVDSGSAPSTRRTAIRNSFNKSTRLRADEDHQMNPTYDHLANQPAPDQTDWRGKPCPDVRTHGLSAVIAWTQQNPRAAASARNFPSNEQAFRVDGSGR